ncbi:hypothetical protein MBLNU459_g7737t2 [Dothideomycetes sp. NU459]
MPLPTPLMTPDRKLAAAADPFLRGFDSPPDTTAYRNEDLVGKGIADGLEKLEYDRSGLWITSKLWNDHHAPDKVEEAIDKTLSDLGLKYLDLYHMHWPVASSKSGNEIQFVDTWKAMVKLVESGKTRYIGVSNFSPAQLETLLHSTTHKPSVHQMEMHPYLQQNDWLAYHKALGIHVTAYSPLAGTNPTYDGKPVDGPPQLLGNKEMIKIAERRNCTTAQVALAWGMSRGNSVIPKSSHADRIDENFGSKKCKLEGEDYEIIADLGETYTHRYNNPSKGWGVKLYEGLEGV